ncbi:MAG: tail fiber domain-containing protein [Chitinophagales bacterium]|nr:tail fiber domain-containing protein [Chitinophagales bacterium]
MKKSILLQTATVCLLLMLSDIRLYGQANQTLSNLTSPTAVNQSLLPGTDNSKNLGSSTKSWKDIYLDGDIYIDGNRFTYLPTATSTFVGNTANSTSTGVGNSAFGYHVLMTNTSGDQNTGAGAYTLDANTTGDDNAGFGYAALSSNTSGAYNCAFGNFSLYNNALYNYNSAFGDNSLRNNTGSYNSAFGARALYSNTGGGHNTANGGFTLYSNTTGSYNTAIGKEALYYNTTGKSNAATGTFALYWNSTGEYNTANGYQALSDNFTGSYNTANGSSSGSHGDGNTYCTFNGYDADQSVDGTFTNSTALGNSSRISASNQVRIGNSSVTSIGGYASWTNISDGRYKKDIKGNVPGIEFINKLKPVTYHLDVSGIRKFLNEDIIGGKDTQGFKEKSAEEKALIDKGVKEKEEVVYTGFIAQEVEQAASEIGYIFSGVDKPENENSLYGLRYAEFVVPLVKAVQELSSTNKELTARIEKLESLLNSSATSPASIDPETSVQKINLESSGNAAILGQNIPNPFEGNTVISYYIPENSSDAKIIFYSERGNWIRSVSISENGHGQISVNASDLSSGIYQYSLIINGQTIETRQMGIAK